MSCSLHAIARTALCITAALATACTSAGGTGTTGGGTGGGTAGGGSGTALTLETLPAALADAVCVSLTKCGTWSSHFASPASCAKFVNSDFSGVQDDIAAVKAGKMTFDAAAAKQCLDAMATVCFGKDGAAPAACEKTFTGLIADGAPCSENNHCASRFCKIDYKQGCGACAPATKAGDACTESAGDCSPDQACIGGKCVADGSATEGQPCSGGGTCASGLYCDYDVMDAVCKAPAAAGSPCKQNEQCAQGLACIYPSMEGPGSCGAPIAVGQPCKKMGGPGSEQCASGSACAMPADWDGKSMPELKCQPLVKLGDACVSHLQCGIDASCSGGKCTALPGSGQPCAAAFMPQPGAKGRCDVGLACGSDGKCGERPGEGKPCNDGSCAKGLKCNYQLEQPVCYTLLAEGAACKPDDGFNCAQGLMCDGAKCVAPVCK